MKKAFATIVLIPVTVLLLDWSIAILQVKSYVRSIGNKNILLALEQRSKPGLTRKEVEKPIEGYREVREAKKDDALVVAYGYWFGIIPPLSMSGLKYVGEVELVYSQEGKVMKSWYWIN